MVKKSKDKKGVAEINNVEFEVGKKYENLKGNYEILSIDRNVMRIRWETGEEISTTVSLQKQIITRMRREQIEDNKEK